MRGRTIHVKEIFEVAERAAALIPGATAKFGGLNMTPPTGA